MKKNIKMGIGMGGPSILMIFVVLSLTTLGTLALTTANADYKLTLKAMNHTVDYYVADSKGEEFLSQIDEGQITNKNSTLIPINEMQDLSVKLRIPGSFDQNYDVISWKTVTNQDWNYNQFEIEFQDQIPE